MTFILHTVYVIMFIPCTSGRADIYAPCLVAHFYFYLYFHILFDNLLHHIIYLIHVYILYTLFITTYKKFIVVTIIGVLLRFGILMYKETGL